jgi:hypothetical protein
MAYLKQLGHTKGIGEQYQADQITEDITEAWAVEAGRTSAVRFAGLMCQIYNMGTERPGIVEKVTVMKHEYFVIKINE